MKREGGCNKNPCRQCKACSLTAIQKELVRNDVMHEARALYGAEATTYYWYFVPAAKRA
ncbi:MAG TPA: hypothetical protein VGB71_16430 [Flavisolibacter sp.]